MKNVSPQIEKKVNRFQEDLNLLFGKSVVSIVLFGSAVTDDYRSGVSDLNFLVVLKPKAMKDMHRVSKHLLRWQRNKISLPLFVTESYIHGSLDSYPVEFLNMKSKYTVIKGKDVLANLKVNKKDIRLQVERELKGKLLQLRQRRILTRGRKRALKMLITHSIVTFTSIFKGLLFLRGKQIPAAKKDVILEACREFTEIDESLFSELLKVYQGTIKLSKDQLEDRVSKYIKQIEALGESVDQMKV